MKTMKKYNRTLIFLTLILLMAGTTLALEDGGGRSVFARGAGERALALGGAYGALADDASALVWNPAGLARVSRKGVYAGHSSLIGLGFSEQSGLVALPSWRWGTVSFGMRRFGVDGIEGRDERGGIFSDNLQDAETELLVGYGRSIGEAWDLGLTFKYRNHELAGYSDGAPGMDLGLMVRPMLALGLGGTAAEELSMGVAVRNVIEPTIRLDEEGVADPTGVRAGLAFGSQVGNNIGWCLAMDVEKTRDMDTHLHMGAETTLMRILSLRVGSNAGMMTAGAGFQVSGLDCDYTFEDNPIETVHRFGLGLAFGKTVEEARQADLAAEEEALRQHLAKAFEQKNNDRVRHFLEEARGAIERGEHQEALGHIASVRVLDPDQEGLTQLEAAAYYQHALDRERADDLSAAQIAYERCLIHEPGYRDAADRLAAAQERANKAADRSARLRGHFEKALALYAQGNLRATRSELETLLEQDPTDGEASDLLRATMATMNLRADSFIEQARAHTTAGNWDAAAGALEKARNMMPDHPALAGATQNLQTRRAEVEGQLAQAEEARRRAASKPAQAEEDAEVEPVVLNTSAPAPVMPSFARLGSQDKAEIEDLYRRGLKAIEDDRHHDAIRYWEIVWDRAPDFQNVAENLKQEYLAMGMEDFAVGQLEQSIRSWEKAQAIDPDDPRTQGYLARAYEHRSRIAEIKGNQ